MTWVVLTNGAVTALSRAPQPGMPEFVQVAEDDARLLAFLSPPASTDDVLNAKLAKGIVLTCTGTPAVSGAYALDEVSIRQIYDLGLFASQFGAFPGGVTQAYPDIGGVPHVFTVAQFVAFLRAVAPLISAMNIQAAILAHGGAPSWPPQTAVIP